MVMHTLVLSQAIMSTSHPCNKPNQARGVTDAARHNIKSTHSRRLCSACLQQEQSNSIKSTWTHNTYLHESGCIAAPLLHLGPAGLGLVAPLGLVVLGYALREAVGP